VYDVVSYAYVIIVHHRHRYAGEAMGRVTVWIPDELLDQARARSHSENTSQLVREGLQRLVGDGGLLPSYARKPAGSSDEIIGLRGRLLAEARDEYERGYGAALAAADVMPLGVLDRLVGMDFELRSWLRDYADLCRDDLGDQAPDPFAEMQADDLVEQILDEVSPAADALREWRDKWLWLWKTAEALGDAADPVGLDRFQFSPTQPRERGYVDAMSDLWSAVLDQSEESDEREGGG
jgi:hypothetical protein